LFVSICSMSWVTALYSNTLFAVGWIKYKNNCNQQPITTTCLCVIMINYS
jgi:hypothetical protein